MLSEYISAQEMFSRIVNMRQLEDVNCLFFVFAIKYNLLNDIMNDLNLNYIFIFH